MTKINKLKSSINLISKSLFLFVYKFIKSFNIVDIIDFQVILLVAGTGVGKSVLNIKKMFFQIQKKKKFKENLIFFISVINLVICVKNTIFKFYKIRIN